MRLVVSFTSQSLYPGERARGTNWRDSTNPTAYLDALEKKNSTAVAGHHTKILGRLAHSLLPIKATLYCKLQKQLSGTVSIYMNIVKGFGVQRRDRHHSVCTKSPSPKKAPQQGESPFHRTRLSCTRILETERRKLHNALWRTRFRRGYGTVVRETTECTILCSRGA
jgi:hypothetical protein